MTKNTTLDTIVSTIKNKNELPFLLEIKHYAKILKEQGVYSKVSYALNDISKALGYRKFNDLRPALVDKGCIVELEFDFEKITTNSYPLGIKLKIECFFESSYDYSLHKVVNSERAHLSLDSKNVTFHYSNHKDIELFTLSVSDKHKKITSNTFLNNLEVFYGELMSSNPKEQYTLGLIFDENDCFRFKLLLHNLIKPKLNIPLFINIINKDSKGCFPLILNSLLGTGIKVENIRFYDLSSMDTTKDFNKLSKEIQDSFSSGSKTEAIVINNLLEFDDKVMISFLSFLQSKGIRLIIETKPNTLDKISLFFKLENKATVNDYIVDLKDIKAFVDENKRILIINPYIKDYKGAFVIKEFNLELITRFDSDLVIVHSDLAQQNLDGIAQLRKDLKVLESSFLS